MHITDGIDICLYVFVSVLVPVCPVCVSCVFVGVCDVESES